MFVPYFDTITGCEITNGQRHDVLYSSRATLLGLAELMCFFCRLLPHYNKQLCELPRGESIREPQYLIGRKLLEEDYD